jgi:hypothetical protein
MKSWFTHSNPQGKLVPALGKRKFYDYEVSRVVREKLGSDYRFIKLGKSPKPHYVERISTGEIIAKEQSALALVKAVLEFTPNDDVSNDTTSDTAAPPYIYNKGQTNGRVSMKEKKAILVGELNALLSLIKEEFEGGDIMLHIHHTKDGEAHEYVTNLEDDSSFGLTIVL